MQGILLIDKPAGWTSFDVVNYVRKIVAQAEGNAAKAAKPKQVKVGHSGTLDPFATGLLVLLVGKEYTKRAAEFSKLDKTYEVTMKLGATSSTGDPEGEIKPYRHPEPAWPAGRQPAGRDSGSRSPISKDLAGSKRSLDFARDDMGGVRDDMGGVRDDRKPTKSEIQSALKQFTGQIEQVPPAYSAVKVNGQRAYKLARAGKEVTIEPRQVTVHRLQVTDYNYPEVKFIAEVSSGTYVRSLVEDIGQILGTGAYTSALRRTQIGDFLIQNSQKPTDISIDKTTEIC